MDPNKGTRYNECAPCKKMAASWRKGTAFHKTMKAQVSYLYIDMRYRAEKLKMPMLTFQEDHFDYWCHTHGLVKMLEVWRLTGYSEMARPVIKLVDPDGTYTFNNICLATVPNSDPIKTEGLEYSVFRMKENFMSK